MKKHIVIDARESGTSTGRYIDKLIEYLHQLKPNYKITVLTTKKRREYVEQMAPSFSVVVSRHKEFTFAEQIGLLKQIRSLKPDLVHFGMTQQPILYRGKVITTMHDLTTARFRNPNKFWLVFKIKQLVYIFVGKIVARKSAFVITPTEFVKEDVAKFGRINSRKIVVTYEAADKISNPAEPVSELEGRQFIMYVGRPQPHKNLRRLVDAFGSLAQEHPGLRLVLVGKKDNAYRDLERYAHEKGTKRVVFTGFASEGELRWLYENTAAYVFPSLSEGFGLPALEAMMHGAPVASSNATCLPEVYKDGALYFDPKNIDDMAGVIKRLLADEKLRQKLIARGHEVAKQYSWKRMAEQTLDVYKQALEN